MSILRTFGNAIRECRINKGWSQEQLAERARLDRSYVSGIERGRRNVSILAALRLSHALNVSLCSLLDESAPEPHAAPSSPRSAGHPGPGGRTRKLATPVPDQMTAVEALSELIRVTGASQSLARLRTARPIRQTAP